MEQNNKAQKMETSQKIQNANQEPIEYFMSETCGFKFCYMESQSPSAEDLVQELNNTEEK